MPSIPASWGPQGFLLSLLHPLPGPLLNLSCTEADLRFLPLMSFDIAWDLLSLTFLQLGQCTVRSLECVCGACVHVR